MSQNATWLTGFPPTLFAPHQLPARL
jgi:hypothetical protein